MAGVARIQFLPYWAAAEASVLCRACTNRCTNSTPTALHYHCSLPDPCPACARQEMIRKAQRDLERDCCYNCFVKVCCCGSCDGLKDGPFAAPPVAVMSKEAAPEDYRARAQKDVGG